MGEPLKEFIKLVRDTAGRWLFVIPPVLIYLAVVFMALKTFLSMLRWNVDSQIFAAYVAAIGLAVAFAVTTFYYSRISEKDRDALVRAGEFFLFGAVALLSGLILIWSTGEVFGLFRGRSVNIFLVVLLLIVNVLNLAFLLYAANSLHRGLQRLQKILFAEVKDEL